MAIGASRTNIGAVPIPVPLDGIGMPGCALLQSLTFGAAFTVAPQAPGTGRFELLLPNRVELLGVHLYLQAWAPAPGVNPAGVVLSNGVDWLLGNM